MEVLSLAGDNQLQERILNELGTRHFIDPLFRQIFKGFCEILLRGEKLNLETLANNFYKKTDPGTFHKICSEMIVKSYVNCSPELETKVNKLIEQLKLSEIERRYLKAN